MKPTLMILGALPLIALMAGCQLGSVRAGKESSPRVTQLLNDGWTFHLGDVTNAQAADFDDAGWRRIDLPHDWSVEQPFDQKFASGTGYLPGGIGWYRKSFALPEAAEGRLVSIQFDGIYKNAEVWINGRSLGRRPNGFVSHAYDLTPHLLPAGQQNVLAVRVDHSDFADARYYTGSGIYREVWLQLNDPVHIARWGTFVSTPEVSKESATVMIKTRVANTTSSSRDLTLVSSIRDRQGKSVATVESTHAVEPGKEYQFEQTARVANPALWSPDSPTLYTVDSQLKSGSTVHDEDRTTLGIRTFNFDPAKGFFLNGARTVFKGVCAHQNEGAFGAAVPKDAIKRRLELLKELGCNAFRTSHYPPSPVLLDLCDEMGFLVMDEAFDEWARPKRKWVEGRNVGEPAFHGAAKDFAELGMRDAQAMVQRDRNHPSIILWSIGNEVDFDKDPYWDPNSPQYTSDKPSAAELVGIAKQLYQAVKEVDSTRPVTAALARVQTSNPTGLADVLDVAGYNYQEQFYTDDHARYPARMIIGSENSHNYSAWKAVEDNAYVTGQFLWTAFDFLGESPGWPVRSSGAGLMDEAGFKKPMFYFRQSLWSDKPMVYIGVAPPGGGGRGGRRGGPATTQARGRGRRVAESWTWPTTSATAPLSVACYTNCEKVDLQLNGKSLGAKQRSEAQDGVLTWQVPYAPGALKAVGMNGDKAVCSFELKTTGSPAAVKLIPDRKSITADGRSFCFYEAQVVDADGSPVFAADHQLSFEITGPGKILGHSSGDLSSHESFRGNTRKVYQGRCLVVVQSTQEPGTIKLKATAPDLTPAENTIRSSK